MKVKRSLRISELLKREVSEIIATKVRDPLVKSIMITNVRVSDDLKYAKIYYRIIKSVQSKEKVKSALERVVKFIRLEVAHRTQLRYVPDIHFFYDSIIDEANRIDSLLEKIKQNYSE